MTTATAAALPDGRLHLHDGPLDLVVGLDGTRAAMAEARARAVAAFEGVLAGLLAELPLLRAPVGADPPALRGRVARRMAAAVWPLRRHAIPPMTAVTGAVAEEVLDAVASVPGLAAAHARHGGDVALFLGPGQVLRVGLAPGPGRVAPDRLVRVRAADPVRGIATAGWAARGASRGVADAVTVLAATAAQAEVAAMVIAEAADAEHPAVRRVPAGTLAPEGTRGARPMTLEVGDLPPALAEAALDAGEAMAERLLQRGLIGAALLVVKEWRRAVGDPRLLPAA